MHALSLVLLLALPSWRVAPPADEGPVQFRPSAEDEAALRALLEAFAAAWNARDGAALGRLALAPADTRAIPPGDLPRLEDLLRAEQAGGAWRMELAGPPSHLRILKAGQVLLRQPYRRMADGAEPSAEVLEATAVRGSRGWRLLGVKVRAQAWPRAHQLTGRIPEPRRTKSVPPRYPEAAKQARLEGVVTLECLITAQGKVTEVRVLHGPPELHDAAAEAVRQWEYEPTILNRQPVPVTLTVTVAFKLS